MSGSPTEEGGLSLAAPVLNTDNSSQTTATGNTPEDQVSEHVLFSLFVYVTAYNIKSFIMVSDTHLGFA